LAQAICLKSSSHAITPSLCVGALWAPRAHVGVKPGIEAMPGSGDPSKNDIIWKGVCEKELDFWAKSMTQSTFSFQQSNMPFYRMPRMGEEVAVSGIRRRPELNGARGEVVSDGLDEHGRITVRVFDRSIPGEGGSRKMKIQPFRLVPFNVAKPDPSGYSSVAQSDVSVRSCTEIGAGSAASRTRRASGSVISSAGKSALSNTGAFRRSASASNLSVLREDS